MILRTLALTSILVFSPAVFSEEKDSSSEFSSYKIDLGLVVSDLDEAVKFYTEAIGFQVSGEFQVAGKYAKDVGLTNGDTLSIKVLTLGKGEGATKLKIMEAPKSDDHGKTSDNRFINSELGFSYLTLAVKSTEVAMARLKKAGISTVAQSPLPLPKELNPDISLTIVRDPDGNLVELVGPHAKK